jgi:hypothetical protein
MVEKERMASCCCGFDFWAERFVGFGPVLRDFVPLVRNRARFDSVSVRV